MAGAAAVLALAVSLFPSPAPRNRIVAAGSSCMGRVMAALAESYASRGEVEIQLGGTELGLQSLRSGVADLASCSRRLTEAETAEFLSVCIAWDAVAVAVHPNNPVRALSVGQLCAIYSGQIDNWRQLGGKDRPIVVIGREAGSGTRAAFEEGIGLKSGARHGQELCETGMVRTAVAQNDGAVGYLSSDYIDGSVRAVAVDGVTASPENVGSGHYPLTRPFLLCTRKNDTARRTEEFVQFASGQQGEEIIRALGMTAFEGGGPR